MFTGVLGLVVVGAVGDSVVGVSVGVGVEVGVAVGVVVIVAVGALVDAGGGTLVDAVGGGGGVTSMGGVLAIPANAFTITIKVTMSIGTSTTPIGKLDTGFGGGVGG